MHPAPQGNAEEALAVMTLFVIKELRAACTAQSPGQADHGASNTCGPVSNSRALQRGQPLAHSIQARQHRCRRQSSQTACLPWVQHRCSCELSQGA